jgi:hypothetical protein
MHTLRHKSSVDERSTHFYGCWSFWRDKDNDEYVAVCVLAKMQEQVANFVIGHILCSTSKPSNQKIGLYMPFPVPSRPWESISMDFLGHFPMTRKIHDYLFFIVDHFSKKFVLIPYKKTIFG